MSESPPIVVQKYGGSSVADVAKIGTVADRVVAAKKAGLAVVVVVSAMGKTTDGLVALAKETAAQGGAEGGAPPRRELDMLVSTGERVTMALLSIAIQARGVDAISFTGSQSGILTSDRHFDARILEVRPHRIEDELARDRVVIVAGYQGMSYRREITTLGRGGSDTTAVALAAALGAARCEIYSDVDGVYSADPRVVAEATHLPEVDLAVLQEMAEAGAKVMNAQAVEWARRSKIVLHARRTEDGPEGRKTVARDLAAGAPLARVASLPPLQGAQGEARSVRAVVGMGEVVGVHVAGAPSARRFLDAVAEMAVGLVDVSLGPAGLTAALPLLNVPDWTACRRTLEAAGGADLQLTAGCTVVSVVGDGLTAAARALPRFLAVLDGAGVAADGVVAGPLRIGARVPATANEALQRALHDAFVIPR